jgi:hypothetical protein
VLGPPTSGQTRDRETKPARERLVLMDAHGLLVFHRSVSAERHSRVQSK